MWKISDKKSRVKFFKWLDNLEFGVIGLPRPDLTLVLRVPAKIAQTLVDKKSSGQRAYVQGKKRDLHEADLGHLRRAEKTFVEIARTFPKTKLLECTQRGILLSIADIHKKIWNEVIKIL